MLQGNVPWCILRSSAFFRYFCKCKHNLDRVNHSWVSYRRVFMTKAPGNLSLKFLNHTSPAASRAKNYKCHTLSSSRIEPDACKRGNGHGFAISLLVQRFSLGTCASYHSLMLQKRDHLCGKCTNLLNNFTPTPRVIVFLYTTANHL